MSDFVDELRTAAEWVEHQDRPCPDYDNLLETAADEIELLLSYVLKLENYLRWINHLAHLHYVGGAFDYEHMRSLANMAAEALSKDGRELPDFDEAVKGAREWAKEMSKRFSEMLDHDPGCDRDHHPDALCDPEKP